MIVNAENLRTLGIAFSARFQNALTAAPSQYALVTEIVPATTRTMEYGWLKAFPRVREWIGDRQLNALQINEYTIKEKAWEVTLEVDRDDIETDNVGIYSTRIAEMGRSAGNHYDELLWPLLNAGWANNCFDGQAFFSTAHPLLDQSGNPTTFANTDGGAGTPWFMVATDALLKPIILQRRKTFEFVAKTQLTDENVFMRNKFLYGSDARHNGGYGLPQVAWGSQQTLDATHYAAARSALRSMTTDYAHPLGLNQFGLVVPPSLEGNAAQIINADRNADGSTNIWYKTASLNVVPWL